MANIVYYEWPGPNPSYICLPQASTANTPLVLNGSGLKIQKPGSVVPFERISRAVSVTTNGNIGGLITISGMFYGAVVSDTIPTPNNTTSQSNILFDSVSSVVCTVSSGPNLISVGSGTTGRTSPFIFNPHCAYPSLTVQVSLLGTINYTLKHGLFEPSLFDDALFQNGVVNPNPNQANAFSVFMNGATTDGYATLNFPIRTAYIAINSSTDGELTAAFLQQGLT